jgi:type II secretory pathway pseudopilin PulG
MTRHRGTSLVEMMVVVVLLGSVGSLTMHLLLLTFYSNAQQQEEAAAECAFSQLESSLRDDVHTARQAEIEDNQLVLKLPQDERIVYAASTHTVSRQRLRQSGDEEQVVHRDRFALPRGLTLVWRKESTGGIDWLLIDLRPHDPQFPEGRKKPRVLRNVHFRIRVGRGQTDGGTP